MNAWRSTVLALAAAGLAAGCGGGSSDDATKTTASPRGPALGGRIAFRRYFDAGQTTGAIFTVNPDGTEERQVTRPPNDTVDDQPAWSPDGRTIAFERCRREKPCAVWTVRPDGSGLRQLSHGREESAPAWSPDGRHLAMDRASGTVVHDQIETSEVVVAGADGRHARTVARLTHHRGDVGGAVWSPDGRRLIYEVVPAVSSEAEAPHPALYVVDARGGKPARITRPTLRAGDHPDWSPDGSRIVFRTQPNGEGPGGDVFTARPDGSGMRRLTHNDGTSIVLSSSYSPDGRWIAYGYSGRDGEPDVYVMRSDGSGRRAVTRTPSWDSAPDWGPTR
jgi:TolB protein